MSRQLQSIVSYGFFSLLLLAGVTACDPATNNSSNGESANVEVKLTDAPANYDAVTIDIQSVRLHADYEEDLDQDSLETDEEAEEEGWITIMDEPLEVNLLDLTNGNDITLGSTTLEEGEYSQLRFILGDNNTVTIDGETIPLKTPSAQQSGLKLQLDADVEAGETYTLLVDFDAAKSIVKAGNSGMYLLKPVLHAVNLAEAGSIGGHVSPAMADSAGFNTHVMAITNDDTLSTITGEEGNYKIMGLLPATYDVVFDPDSEMYEDTTITGVEVIAGEETPVDSLSFR
ncbi:DUF4382 domain-containing protein [Fodinibius salsisoli]|uniref:DUF4382 domain-containing protein n=1 Tax=Fodinibius salsisoli TaxID=2820877 RepID=A0ABT3PS29_9BACT|nr:DUF4382 domain-containing protein [Fodinibius salsisoli]MCW9708668.1 DUF4382 domain-containing protein [Fodinibius salsisoli]